MCNNIHMSDKYEVTFIIPSFNEEFNIKILFERIELIFKEIPFDVIYIDDGSKDNTFHEIVKIAKNNKNVKAIRFSRNFGKEAALYAGLERADGDYTCIIDADMQQDPEVALKMYDVLKNNIDIDCISAVPTKRRDNPLMNIIKNTFFNIINKMSEVGIEKNASDFRMFRSNVKDALLNLKEENRFLKGMFSWVGFNMTCIEYDVKPRATGSTKWSFKKLFKYALDGIMSFSSSPLKFPILFGLITLFIGVIMIIINACNSIIFSSLKNNTIIVILLIIVSFMFISFGIIGAYISKIYSQNKNRPIYIIKERI